MLVPPPPAAITETFYLIIESSHCKSFKYLVCIDFICNSKYQIFQWTCSDLRRMRGYQDSKPSNGHQWTCPVASASMFQPPHVFSIVCSADQRLLEESVAILCKNFAIDNCRTGNFGSLVRVFILRAGELKASSNVEEWVKFFICVNNCWPFPCRQTWMIPCKLGLQAAFWHHHIISRNVID